MVEAMQIVEVIPIGRGVLPETLTYFTAQNIVPGAVVTVPIKRRQMPALVINSRPAHELKTAIKGAEFSLKKLSSVKWSRLFEQDFITAINKTANYFIGTTGQVLKHFTSQSILERDNRSRESFPPSPVTTEDDYRAKVKVERLVLQDTDSERLAFYKSLVRAEFAKKRSVFLCQPTVAQLELTLGALERGINEYTIVLHHGLGKKELEEAWERAASEPHAVLVVATPIFLSLPRADIGTLIVDQEGSPAYKELTRPFTDIRTFAEFLAQEKSMKLIFGDVCVRTETLHRINQHELLPAAPLKKRFVTTARVRLSLADKKDILTDQTKILIETAREKNERTFILCNRRGVSTVVTCDDCGQLVLCNNCSAPVVLHDPNIFLCHHCGDERKADDKCKNCKGWRLSALGTGIDRVAAEITKLWSDQRLLRFDSDKVKTASRAKEMISRFYRNPGSILLGTELALYYMGDKFENAVLVALDSLLSVPDFRIEEKIFNLGLRVRQLTTKDFLVQTRSPDSPLFADIANGDFLNFYQRQLQDRKKFGYPPYKFFIKVTGSDNAETAKIFAALAETHTAHEPAIFPSLNGKYSHLLFRLNPGIWPDPALAGSLKRLPPTLTVTVDPESVM